MDKIELPKLIRDWTPPFHITMDGIKDAKGCWIMSASNHALATQLVELVNFAASLTATTSEPVAVKAGMVLVPRELTIKQKVPGVIVYTKIAGECRPVALAAAWTAICDTFADAPTSEPVAVKALIEEILVARQARAEALHDMLMDARELVRAKLNPQTPPDERDVFDKLQAALYTLRGDPFDMHIRSALTTPPAPAALDVAIEALEPFAAQAELVVDVLGDDYCPDWSPFIPQKAYTKAAAALARAAKEGQ